MSLVSESLNRENNSDRLIDTKWSNTGDITAIIIVNCQRGD